MISDALLQVLACPRCGARLETERDCALRCNGCGLEVPVRAGIPRFVDTPADALARRTQASFGYEWTHFDDWSASGETNFDQYFSGLDLGTLGAARVLDAGCGMGRHARMIAPHAARVTAMDFSAAIEAAARNTRDTGNVDCVQGDITALPFADDAFDYAYSLGVLHHIADTAGALNGIVRKVRPGGRVRVYLYWKHHGWKGTALRLVDAARHVTTRLPHPVLRAFCWGLSAALMVAVIWPYRVLSRLGVRAHGKLPLFVYARYPFRILYNDQFDRFSAPLEQRFDPDEVVRLLEGAGLRDVTVHASFGWIGEGTRQGTTGC
jgi:SAM-dependent methyltransferase